MHCPATFNGGGRGSRVRRAVPRAPLDARCPSAGRWARCAPLARSRVYAARPSHALCVALLCVWRRGVACHQWRARMHEQSAALAVHGRNCTAAAARCPMGQAADNHFLGSMAGVGAGGRHWRQWCSHAHAGQRSDACRLQRSCGPPRQTPAPPWRVRGKSICSAALGCVQPCTLGTRTLISLTGTSTGRPMQGRSAAQSAV